jgi:hypothetical protein
MRPKPAIRQEGWTFETKVLDRDLVLGTRKSDGWASILRNDLDCTHRRACFAISGGCPPWTTAKP